MLGSKIKCVVLNKNVSTETAKFCDDFTPMPTSGSGAAFAMKVLSPDYQPTCEDCGHNKENRLF